MTAGSMVTGSAPRHTVTNIRLHRSSRALVPSQPHRRRISMQQDTRADRSQADTASRSADIADDRGIDDDSGVTEELLVEEVSIDGMCGVY
jgi:mycofactocin precursor